MADLIQSHKGICSLNEENYEMSLLVFDKFFFHSFNTTKDIPLQFDKFLYCSFNKIKEKVLKCHLLQLQFDEFLSSPWMQNNNALTLHCTCICICLPGLLPTVMPLTAIAIWRVFITFLSPWMNAELECAITRHCAPHSHASWYVGLLCTAAAVCT